MATYILIFAIYMQRGGAPATAEFADKAACEQAIASIRETVSSSMRFAICVPKASEPRS